MSFAKAATIALAVGAFTFPGAALADPGRLNIIIGGEAYDGPPRFEVTFAGTLLGEGVVERAIDTAAAGRFADAADKTAYVENITFEIPDYLFRPDAEVRVRLINNAMGDPGSNRERNLYLAAVAVNGGAVTVSGLVTATNEGFKPNHTVGEFLLLASGTEEGVSPPPRGGWPEPSAALIAASEGRLVPDTRNQPGMDPPAGLATLVMPATGVAPEAEEEAKAEAAAPAVALASAREAASGGDTPAPACGLDQIYNVVGFNENSNDLTPRLMGRLDQIIEDIGDERCRVLVTGYSSTLGPHATNALFAVERAQNVLAYLKANGLQFYRATAAGGGGTEQFGPTPAENRRVVITVLP